MNIDKPNSKIVINNRLTHDGLINDILKEMERVEISNRRHPLVLETAKKFKRNTELETARAAFNYVVAKVPYKSDPPDREHIVAPIQLISGNVVGEDCESMVLLLSTLLNVLGIETKYTVIAWRKRQFTHVILKAKINNQWVKLDPTRGAEGFGKSVPDNKIIREKDYGVRKMEMKVETLEDNTGRYLSDCGCNQALSDCGCNQALSDCGCGGKCGKSKGNAPTNQNINIIPIGNTLEQLFNQPSTPGRDRIIEKNIPQPYPVVREKKVPYLIPDALTREKVEALARDSKVPVRVLTTQKQDYMYKEYY